MKTKTKDLIGIALEWAIATVEGHAVVVLTVDDQRARWIGDDGTPEGQSKRAAEWDSYFSATARPELCVAWGDGYKRGPTHDEARTVFAEGIPRFRFSTSWAQGGPIIERERIEIRPGERQEGWFGSIHNVRMFMPGPTALIAAMRCHVASKLGDEIEVPDELTGA